jgi:outer membrane protein assembly factor BamB
MAVRGTNSWQVLAWSLALLTGVGACSDAAIPFGQAGGDRVLWWVKERVGDGFPSVDATQVYFTSQPHRVTAVAKATGRIAWTRDLPVDRSGFFGEGTLARGGRVFVADEDVFALDARTGEVLWRFRPAGSRNTGVFLPAFDGDRLITGSTSGHVFAISHSTGEEVWRSKVVLPDTVTMYRPQVGEGVVAVGFTDYVTAGGNVARGGVAVLDVANGHVRWLRYLPIAIDSSIANGVISPVIVDGAVVIGAWDGPVYAFELNSGALRWTSPGVGFGDQIRGLRPLATDGSRVFVGSSAGVVQALDPRTGARVWSAAPSYGSTN